MKVFVLEMTISFNQTNDEQPEQREELPSFNVGKHVQWVSFVPGVWTSRNTYVDDGLLYCWRKGECKV